MFFLKFTAKSVEGLFKNHSQYILTIYLLMIKHKGKYRCTLLHMHIKKVLYMTVLKCYVLSAEILNM